MSALYSLTSLVCAIWLAQSAYDAYQRHLLLYWPNVVFFISMIAVIAGSIYQAMHVTRSSAADNQD